VNFDELIRESHERAAEERERRPAPTAEGRYAQRKPHFVKDGAPFPGLRHHALWLLHNCVAHPLLALGAQPSEHAISFHELTSRWLNHKTMLTWSPGQKRHYVTHDMGIPVPEVKGRKAWVVHNVLAHLAIGLVPCKATFDFHDRSAREMNVEGWV